MFMRSVLSKGLIVLITGDFCVGKDTVADMLCEIINGDDDPNMPFALKIRSYTTREERYKDEDTHVFCTKEEFESFTDFIAQTEINGEYYGARLSQFSRSLINVYVVDDKGVYDISNANLDCNIMVIQVVRPKWLVNCPKSRTNRERTFDAPIHIDYRIFNSGTESQLYMTCCDCWAYIQNEFLD